MAILLAMAFFSGLRLPAACLKSGHMSPNWADRRQSRRRSGADAAENRCGQAFMERRRLDGGAHRRVGTCACGGCSSIGQSTGLWYQGLRVQVPSLAPAPPLPRTAGCRTPAARMQPGAAIPLPSVHVQGAGNCGGASGAPGAAGADAVGPVTPFDRGAGSSDQTGSPLASRGTSPGVTARVLPTYSGEAAQALNETAANPAHTPCWIALSANLLFIPPDLFSHAGSLDATSCPGLCRDGAPLTSRPS